MRPQWRRVEFAEAVGELCAQMYPEAESMRLLCDRLNTHQASAFYEAFVPAEARRLAAKVEFIHRLVHGSWLHVVEVDLSLFSWQCLGHRRFGLVEELEPEP